LDSADLDAVVLSNSGRSWRPADATLAEIPAPLNGVAQAPVARERMDPRRWARRAWLLRRLLVGADVVGLVVAFLATQFMLDGRLISNLGIRSEIAILLLAIPAWIVVAKLYGLYDRDDERAAHSSVDEFVDLFHLITVGVWGLFVWVWIIGVHNPNQTKLVVFWLLAIATVTTARAATRAAARRQSAYLQNTIIVGAGDVGQLIARKLRQHPEYGINLIGFVDAEPREQRDDLGGLRILGALSDLRDIVDRKNIDRVIVAFSNDGHEELLIALRSLLREEVQIDVVPRLFEVVNPRVAIHTVEALPLLGLPPARIPRSSRFLKRCIDVVAASMLLAVAAPLLALIAVLIRRGSPGPALFRQTRLGMDMREFTLLKFRTMQEGTDEAVHREYIGRIMDSSALPTSRNLYKLERPEAVTRIGRVLRKTSLDELPQLLNVLLGDMSLVGPRPCIPYETAFFAPHHFERFLVPAGLTGLWQVEARAHASFGEALDLDVLYARGWSLGLDLRLLARTPFLMLRKRETD
jgi:exopolysaccharide biosynthesis polyprenyl glycosylphosphotransferase